MPPAFAPFKVARSSAVVVWRATILRGTTGNRIGAASVIVGGLHGFRSWLPLSGGSMPVRNSSEHLRPSNNAAPDPIPPQDRKSTRLNSSHGYISYAVFCLKKKKHSNFF